MSEPKSETAEKVTKEPKEKASFLDKPITRRDILKLAAVGGVSYVLKDFIESNQDTNEYDVPERVEKAILFLKEIDLVLPKDQLYGFTFPSTREMAEKYEEALSRKVSRSQVPSLIIVQEKEPKTLIRFVRVNLGLEKKHDSPVVSPADNLDSPSLLYLPHYTQKDSTAETAVTLYHEGTHLFYQKPYPSTPTAQEIFDSENVPTIAANVLLNQLLLERDHKVLESTIAPAYFQAVAENNRGFWEQALKKLYELPADCCILKPANK